MRRTRQSLLAGVTEEQKIIASNVYKTEEIRYRNNLRKDKARAARKVMRATRSLEHCTQSGPTVIRGPLRLPLNV